MGKRGVENVADASIDALRIAMNVAQEYVLRATTRRVSPSAKDVAALARFHEGFPAEPSDAVSVIELLHEIGGPATVATTGGRYFGYVIGGALPASMARTGWRVRGTRTWRYGQCRLSLRNCSGAGRSGAAEDDDHDRGVPAGRRAQQEAKDYAQLLPAVERLERRLKEKPRQVVADAGYTTRDNIEQMAEREIDFLGSMVWENVPSGTSTPNHLPPSAFV